MKMTVSSERVSSHHKQNDVTHINATLLGKLTLKHV